MSINNPDVYLLINSLSKSEKRYFKRHCSLHGTISNNKYIQLFDIIEKQTRSARGYNNELVKSQTKDLFKNQELSVFKNYLFHHILNSLAEYNKASSLEIQLRNSLSQSEILYQKGLFDQAKKMIRSLLETSYKNEFWGILTEACILQLAIINQSPHTQRDVKEIEQLLKYDEIAHERSCEQINYRKLMYKLASINFYEIIHKRSKEKLLSLNNLFKSNLLDPQKTPTSFSSVRHYYFLRYIECLSKNDETGAYEQLKKLIDYFETTKLTTSNQVENFIIAYYNYLSSCYKLEKYNECIKGHQSLVTKAGNKRVSSIGKSIIQITLPTLLAATYNKTGEFNEALKQLHAAEKVLENEPSKNLEQHITIVYYLLTLTYAYKQNYTKASQYLIKLVNHSDIKNREDALPAIKTLELVLAFEAKNLHTMEGILSSYKYYLKSRKMKYKTEQVIVELFSKYQKTPDQKNFLDACKKTLPELLKLADDPFEKSFLDYFDISIWIQSKIKGR